MMTVPKSAKTDRIICYEPHMNIRLQLNVGRYIRSRLARAGINLDDQSVNQRRARYGSRTGLLATIDLRSASDTVALELVHELLPYDWACLLEDLRSKYTKWPCGSSKRNQKFSSMGNGFTFELESLLFGALAGAVTENVSVYGDDLVVPSDSFSAVCAVLEGCGFEINTSKSFDSGYFRESCGDDSFCGVDVTPVYLRALPKVRGDLVKFHNQVRDWCSRTVLPGSSWAAMLRKWREIHPVTVGPSRTWNGKRLNDGHYFVNLDEANPVRAPFWVDGWWYSTYVEKGSDATDDSSSDHIEGNFDVGLGWAAICASTGPKRPRSLWDAVVSQKQRVYKKHRGLASFTWPNISWE